MTFLYLILLTNVTKNKCNSTIWLNPLLQPTYQTTKTAFFHLRNIARLCPSLPFSAAETLTHAFTTSRLDYRSSLIRGSSSKTLKKLQYSQNPAARLLRHCRTLAPPSNSVLTELLSALPPALSGLLTQPPVVLYCFHCFVVVLC